MPLIRSANCNLLIEVLIRIGLLSAFCYMEGMSPFERVISESELLENCKYPRRESYVPGTLLWGIVLSVPCVLSFLAWAVCNDCNDALEILLTWSLSLGLTGFITNLVKLIVGRPRPDYFYRCFPDGAPSDACTGDARDVIEGRKSFPSGHSSLSFSSLGVAGAWLYCRLARSRAPPSLRLSLSAAPLMVALCVALSRTCDYHHHWQDVLVGSLIGFGISIICYRQYYNPITSELCSIPYIVTCVKTSGRLDSPAKSEMESTPLLKKQDKWI